MRTTDSQPREASTLNPSDGESPSPSGEPTFPLPDWDRYQPVRFLGQGGMGQVFLAYEPLLRRNVALKFVRGEDPELARRFLSEARAQARVRHERVCEVYEVGEVRGRGYIAMRYVEGQPLSELAPTLTLEQKVLVLQRAAEGVHAAHRAGLIHRDIKPSNILVTRTEDGGLAPYVMDFGLARDWREEGTATHAVLGTPHYMAPEQARGEVSRLDRRVDVYALGATLYALLTGQPPLSGTNALEVLTRIQNEEPRPPRSLDRDIPEDLQAIVLKCLEKERSARYDSARALAEDLERFLAGEPVQARRAGAWYRLRKKARKHRLLVSLGSVSLAVVLLALGQAGLARREVAVRERLSRRYTEQVERLEAMARYSALSRLHDTRADRQALRARMEALEAEVHQAGEQAVGPGHFAVGRALLALGDVDEALVRLESAWSHGYLVPRVAEALALALGHLYREHRLELENLRDATQREARRREVERRYREPALDYLRRGEAAEFSSPPQYISALLAFYEGRHAEALELLEGLGDTQPWFYEAPLLRGDILQARGSQRWNQGDRAGALADFDAGRHAYAAAATIAESAPDVHYALARLELSALLMEMYGRGDVRPHYERGLEAVSRALAAAPDHYLSRVMEGRLHRRMAELLIHKGEDAEPLLRQALASLQAAQALAPEHSRARKELAFVLRQWAFALQQRGEDPRELLRQASAAFEAVGPEERDYAFHTNLGQLFKVWADYEDESGGDSLEYRERAIQAYLAALALDENRADAWMNLGTAYLKRSAHPRGGAEEDLEHAREALERALAINPDHLVPCFYGADVYMQLARRRRTRGEAYAPELERALALYHQGLSINPRLPQLHNGLGTALLWQAEQVGQDGGDPEPLFEQARAAYEQARAVAPKQAFAYNNLGEVHSARAAFRSARGEDPTPGVQAAVEAYQQALALLRHAEFWANLAKAWHTLAAWELERGSDPRAHLDRASEALERALELNARNGSAWRYLGETRGVRARWLARQGRARDEDFSQAAEAFQQALALAPQRTDYRAAAEHLQREWASWRERPAGLATSSPSPSPSRSRPTPSSHPAPR
ncbi:MAG TPA: protein kinase [Myxococcaceae bacterium]|nr:protein kinase [Myxococcaceae bacterium]